MRVDYHNPKSCKEILSLFFDFYVLNEVWFRTVGMEVYGYAASIILPAAKERAIDSTFRAKVAAIKNEVVNALEASVRHEVRHWADETNRNKAFRKTCAAVGIKGHDWDDGSEYDEGKEYTYADGKAFSKLPLPSISMMYHARCWHRQYGGSRWGKGVDLLIKLKESKNIKDDIFLIDQIFDLQHNTGFILNKTGFAGLEDRVNRRLPNGRKTQIKALNFRFRGSTEELSEHCSWRVKGLYVANKNYLKITPNLLTFGGISDINTANENLAPQS
jgi:hypothetical protein